MHSALDSYRCPTELSPGQTSGGAPVSVLSRIFSATPRSYPSCLVPLSICHRKIHFYRHLYIREEVVRAGFFDHVMQRVASSRELLQRVRSPHPTREWNPGSEGMLNTKKEEDNSSVKNLLALMQSFTATQRLLTSVHLRDFIAGQESTV